MPKLGLTSTLGTSGLVTPGIVTSNLVLKHKYDAGSVVPVSDGAAFFDGSGDVITVTDNDELDVRAVDYSFSAWVYLTSDTADLGIIGKRSGTTDRYYWRINDSAKPDFYANEGGTTVSTTSTNAISAYEWTHIALTLDRDGDCVHYINGVIDRTHSSVSNLTTDIDVNADMTIGMRQAGGAGSFTGYIANLGLWQGTAISHDIIKSIMWKRYAELTTAEASGLVAWYTLDTNANDSTGTHNGTTTGF